MLFEEYKSKINVALTLNDLGKILNDIESTGVYVNSQGEKIYISKLDMYPPLLDTQ